MVSGIRWTLDLAHVVDGRVIRRHLTRLTAVQMTELVMAERCMPGAVYAERSQHVPGDRSWIAEWRAA